jgi:hypothetical protein
MEWSVSRYGLFIPRIEVPAVPVGWVWDVVEALLPYRYATKIFLPIFDLEKNVIPQNINQSKNMYFI